MLLLLSKAVKTSFTDIFIAFKEEGVIAISYCLRNPPQVLISTTPFIPDN